MPTLAWPLAARAYRWLAHLDPGYWYLFTASYCPCALAYCVVLEVDSHPVLACTSAVLYFCLASG